MLKLPAWAVGLLLLSLCIVVPIAWILSPGGWSSASVKPVRALTITLTDGTLSEFLGKINEYGRLNKFKVIVQSGLATDITLGRPDVEVLGDNHLKDEEFKFEFLSNDDRHRVGHEIIDPLVDSFKAYIGQVAGASVTEGRQEGTK